MGRIIDGKAVAKKIREGLAEEIKKDEIRACLAVVLIGDDQGSQTYVGMKERVAKEIGIKSIVKKLPANTTEAEASKVVRDLNSDPSVNGILVQLPLPKHLNEFNVLSNISPEKDVDGICEINMGKLMLGLEPNFYPCTPAGIMELIDTTGVEIKGKNAVVIGRSNIVGKPVAMMLLKRHATVTICHSRTADLPAVARGADILVAAIGKTEFVTKDMVKKGAIIIDVGTNRKDGKLVGDVDFESVKNIADFITPSPGGVGPMTIAMLMSNCVKAARMQAQK